MNSPLDEIEESLKETIAYWEWVHEQDNTACTIKEAEKTKKALAHIQKLRESLPTGGGLAVRDAEEFIGKREVFADSKDGLNAHCCFEDVYKTAKALSDFVGGGDEHS